MLKQCPRCGITCDKYDAEAIDELFGFRMYKNAEYQQSQCKKCRSKEPIKRIAVLDPQTNVTMICKQAEAAYMEIRPLPELYEPIEQKQTYPEPSALYPFEPVKVYPACSNCADKVIYCPHKPARSAVVELKPCQRDNQPLVKFPIDSEPSQLERNLLQTIYIKTYPRDKEGPKRSYNFMWNKLHKRGLV